MERPPICKHFETLPDPRVTGRCDHELIDVIVNSILAVVCGADGWEDIHHFAVIREPWLSQLLASSQLLPRKLDDVIKQVIAQAI